MSFKVPEQYRDGFLSASGDGNNGMFIIPSVRPKDTLIIIASDGLGWEHVSVSKKYEPPNWTEMCRVKELFWDSEDCVIQYHPPKSSYVNNHPYCLHLWRPIGQKIPLPDAVLVGFK